MTGSNSSVDSAGSFALGRSLVKRIGYGAMQLAGYNVFGPPIDRGEAIKVLRAVIDSGRSCLGSLEGCEFVLISLIRSTAATQAIGSPGISQGGF
jgi:hypothetical protein